MAHGTCWKNWALFPSSGHTTFTVYVFLTEVDTNPQLEGSGGAVQSHYDQSTRTVQNLCVTRNTLFKCPLQMEIGH